MIITKNAKNYNRHQSIKPIKLNLDIMMYDILCRYVLQEHAIVRMEHLMNLRKLVAVIDRSTYENDPEKVKRVSFIVKALEARLDNNIQDRKLILLYINGGLTFKIEFLDYDNLNLSKDEILYIHNLVSETLQYQFLYNSVDNILDIATRFKTTDFNSRGNIVQEFENIVDDLKTNFRRSKMNDNSVDMTFSLRPGVFENAVTDTYNIITNPSRRLITGMQGFNEMIGGGFESGRVYMLLGTSGVGKSITLLNIIYQMKMFNPHFRPKDPTKIPCVVLLTMENTVVETITRLFDLVIENSRGMENYSINEVIDMLKTEGQLILSESSPIDIVIKYKANKSVDTSYLYTLYDDLEDEGYEMICLVQDHVKRIRSIYSATELRLELGDIVNEFKVFAADRDIPVITNSHLNREAAKILEDAARKTNVDPAKLLGKSNIGESMLMIDNLDCGIIIHKSTDQEENLYMSFNLVKMRAKTTRMYIAQPFMPDSTIRMVTDFGGIPQFKESICGNVEIKSNTVIKLSGSSTMFNDINDVIDVTEDDQKSNAFAKQSYNLNNVSVQNPIIQPIEFTRVLGIDQFKKELESKVQYANEYGEFYDTSNPDKPYQPIEFDYYEKNN